MKKWYYPAAIGFVVVVFWVGTTVERSVDIGNEVLSDKHSALAPRASEAGPTNVSSHTEQHQIGHVALSDQNFESELIEQLKGRYGDSISRLDVQASLMRIQAFVMERYPDDGLARFRRIILGAFPQYAESIFSVLERLARYNEWLIENHSQLADLGHLERNGMLWAKRHELFGEDAKLIWSDEREELARKKSELQAAMKSLDQDDHSGLDEKLFQLQTALSKQYEGSLQGMVADPGAVAQTFFYFESVQKQLQALDKEKRQEAMNSIRRQLGYSQAQIDSLALKDEERSLRWENGLAYMAEREAVVASVSEARLPEELKRLREKYFEHEAITIEREEESDFWRFKRRRILGVN